MKRDSSAWSERPASNAVRDEIRALRRLQREQPPGPHVLTAERGGPYAVFDPPPYATARLRIRPGKPATMRALQAWLGHRNIQHNRYTDRYTELVQGFPARMSVLIHEQGGRRTIYYPDDRHLRMYDAAGPTLISIEIWPDPASAENAFRSGLVTWENDPHAPDSPVAF